MQNKFSSRSSSSSSQQPVLASIACDKCPHLCEIPPDSSGRCQVICNDSGQLKNSHFDRFSSIFVEPIEKRPFFHFNPGTKFLSAGGYGCQFSCRFCQNFMVSQRIGEGRFYSPQNLVQLALEKEAKGIVFTYNEPTIYHNYIEEVGHEIGRKRLKLKLAIKTSGFVNPYVIRNLCLYVDAINVDIKGDNRDYQKVCGGWLDPVMECIELIVRMQTHLEISYLVLPSKIDDLHFNIYLRNWLADADTAIPVHLLYFYPFHEMIVPSYSPSKLIELAELFKYKMKYVYISNHYSNDVVAYRNTCCPDCDSIVVDRQHGLSIKKTVCCGNHFLFV